MSLLQTPATALVSKSYQELFGIRKSDFANEKTVQSCKDAVRRLWTLQAEDIQKWGRLR